MVDNADLKTLMMMWEAAAECLKLLEECGASPEVFAAQRERCGMLRSRMAALTPDSATYDPNEGNIVAYIEPFSWK